MKQEHAVIRMEVLGHKAWLKVYARDDRGFKLAILDLAARGLGIPALRPPSHHGGERACAIEKQRIEALAACGALVPEVLGVGPRALLLADIGTTLKNVLHAAADDAQARLIARAAQALAQAHARGGYIGQPYARNMTVAHDGRIGFIDLEEDPRESMSLEQAQVRDWLIFAAGVSRYFADPARQLGAALRPVLHSVPASTHAELARAVARLRIVEWIARRLGERARRIAGALEGLRNALAG